MSLLFFLPSKCLCPLTFATKKPVFFRKKVHCLFVPAMLFCGQRHPLNAKRNGIVEISPLDEMHEVISMASLTEQTESFLTRHFTRPSLTWRQSFLLIVPLLAENTFSTMFGLINTGMISAAGMASLSAVSLIDTLNGFLFVFYSGIATGACVVVANYRGRGNAEKLHEACVQAVTAVTLFTIATSLFIFLLHGPVLQLLLGAADPDVFEKGKLYLLGGALTLPLVGVTTAMCGVLRGIGEGRTALLYTIISSGLYVLLNVVTLSILQMDIPGLILSISLSRVLNVPLLFLLKHLGKSSFRFRVRELLRINFYILRSIMRVGFPCALESLFFTGGRLVTQGFIVPMGTMAVVSYNVSYSVMSLIQIFANTINSAMFTIAGICMGKGRTDDVRSLTKSWFAVNTAIYVVMIGVTLISFDFLVQFYNAPAEIVPQIYQCVLMTAIVQPIVHNAGFMLPSVFRAVGDGAYCTVVSLSIMWIVRVFGGYALGVWLAMGVPGVWIAMILDWAVRAIIYGVRFRGSRWLRHRILD